MQKGNTLVIALIVIALLLVGGGVAFFMTQNQNNQGSTPVEDVIVEEPTAEEDNAMEKNVDATGQATMDSENTTTITLSAENFKYSQPEIRVKKGDNVKIVLQVTAGMHDWVVDELNARTKVTSTGQTSEVTFVADEVGEFEYYCSVGNHRQLGMVGTLIVEE